MRLSRARRALASTAVLLLVAAACGGDDDETTSSSASEEDTESTEAPEQAAVDCDFEGDEIKVGSQVATGALVGEQFLDFVPGARARFEKENAAGGIDGRTFTIVEREAQLDPTVVTQNMSELVEQENVSAILSADPAQPAAAQYLADQGVPVIGFAINTVWGQNDNMTGPGGDTFPDVYAPAAPNALMKQAVEDGATHLASFGFSISEESMAAAKNVARSWELSGGEKATVYEANFGATDFTADAQKLLEDGVDAIAGSITRDSFIQLVVAARQAGVDLKFALSPTGYEETTLEQNGDELAGVYVASGAAPFELELPVHEEYLAAMEEYSPERPAKQQIAVVGWLSADFLIEAIKAGGNCPTREAILDGMSKMEDYDGGGFVEPWDPGADQGIQQLCGWSLRVSDAGDAFEPQFDGEPQCTAVEDYER